MAIVKNFKSYVKKLIKMLKKASFLNMIIKKYMFFVCPMLIQGKEKSYMEKNNGLYYKRNSKER